MRGFGGKSSASFSIRFQVEPKGRKCREVCRHCVVAKEAGDDLPQPRSLHWDGLMHSLPGAVGMWLYNAPGSLCRSQKCKIACNTGSDSDLMMAHDGCI